MLIVLFRISTQIAQSASYNNNCYTTGDSTHEQYFPEFSISKEKNGFQLSIQLSSFQKKKKICEIFHIPYTCILISLDMRLIKISNNTEQWL